MYSSPPELIEMLKRLKSAVEVGMACQDHMIEDSSKPYSNYDLVLGDFGIVDFKAKGIRPSHGHGHGE